MGTERLDDVSIARHRRRLLLTETTIGIIVAGGVFPLILLLAKVPSPSQLGGSDGFVADAAKATIPAVFLMALLVTLELRLRGRAGRLGPVAAPAGGWHDYMPAGLVTRALLCTALALLTFAPLRVLACWLLGLHDLTAADFAIVNVVYGVFIGAVATPLLAIAALADLSPTVRVVDRL